MNRFLIFSQPTFLLFLFFTCFNSSFCQESHKNDNSIQKIINLNDDTLKVNKLISIAQALSNSDYLVANNLLARASTISEKINYTIGIGNAKYLTSILFLKQGNFDTAIYYINYAVKTYQSINFKIGLASCYNVLGSLHRRKGLISTCLEYHRNSLSLFSSLNDSLGLAKTNNFIGIAYKDLAQYDSAIVYYLKLIRISEQIGYNEGYISGLINTGQVFIELKEYQKAKKYLAESIEINREINDILNLALAYNKIGMTEFYQGNIDSALFYYDLAHKKYSQLGYTNDIGHVILNVGNVYESQQKYKIAFEKYIEAKSYFEKENLKSGILKAYINIAVINKKQQKYQKSLTYYDFAINLARDIEANDELLKIYDNIHKTYREMRRNDLAIEYLDKYISLKDSIFNIEKATIISDHELKYEQEKNEAHPDLHQ